MGGGGPSVPLRVRLCGYEPTRAGAARHGDVVGPDSGGRRLVPRDQDSGDRGGIRFVATIMQDARYDRRFGDLVTPGGLDPYSVRVVFLDLACGIHHGSARLVHLGG
jgi:hypothetical protein